MPDRPGFALLLSEKTGLAPEVCLGWAVWESDPQHEIHHPYNWTNWKAGPDIASVPTDGACWPAKDGGCFPGYVTLQDAMVACLIRLSSRRYDAIRQSIGQGVQAQLDAIRASDWGTKHIDKVAFAQKDLMWCWISWWRGRGWAKEYGPRDRTHRPPFEALAGVKRIPLSWWVTLAASIVGKKQ